jgi:hypothetical protein
VVTKNNLEGDRREHVRELRRYGIENQELRGEYDQGEEGDEELTGRRKFKVKSCAGRTFKLPARSMRPPIGFLELQCSL